MASPSFNHGLVDGKEYHLKLGASFQGNKASESYHMMRYDFKPTSVDTSTPAEVIIGSNNECTVNIPKESGVTSYKGGKKPCTKECILIIDKETGEIVLERISSNIPLKKSRANRTAQMTTSLNKNAPKGSSSVSKVSAVSAVSTSQSSSTSQGSSQGLSQASNKSHGSTHSNANLNSPLKATTSAAVSNAATPIASLPLSQPTPVKGRGMSTSTSGSSSSGSSDSDSEAERESAALLEAEAFSTKAYEPPPPPTTTAANSKGFMSTLHSDLQLSDDESDSD